MYSILNKLSEYIYTFTYQKHYFIHFCCLFSKLSKASSASLRIFVTDQPSTFEGMLYSRASFLQAIDFSKLFSRTPKRGCFRLCYLSVLFFYIFRSHFIYEVISICSPSQVFQLKGVLRICSKFTGEHPCRSAISVGLLCSFIQIALWNRCSPVNLLRIFRTSSFKNTYQGLLLK